MRAVYDNYEGEELNKILNTIECMKLDYDEEQFLMEDIEEAILIELNII
jgi:hypothetical protein